LAKIMSGHRAGSGHAALLNMGEALYMRMLLGSDKARADPSELVTHDFMCPADAWHPRKNSIMQF
jgi:hypothetical protein